MNSNYVLAVFCSSIANALFGYHLVAFNNTSSLMYFGLYDQTPISALYSLGGLIGSLLAGLPWRRKWFFACIGLTSSIGALLQLFKQLELVLAGRILVGIGAGLGLNISAIYIAEISPPRFRGAALNVTALMTTSAILLSSLIGYLSNWHTNIGVALGLGLLLLLLLYTMPESPKWLLHHGHRERARQSLKHIRSQDSIISNESQNETPQASLKSFFQDRDRIYRVILICVLHALQQLSGINVIFYYSTLLFSEIFPDNPNLYSVLLTAFNLLSSIPLFWLVDKCQRKTLLQITFAGTAIGHTCLTISITLGLPNMTLFAILLNIVCFNSGIGLLPFLLIPELFDVDYVNIGSAFAVATNWIFNFVVAISFLGLLSSIKAYSFLVYAGFMVLGVFVAHGLPDTRG